MSRAITHLKESMLLAASMLLAMPAYADLKLPLHVSDNRGIDNDDVGLSKTLERNFSPEDRAHLRKALTDYARNTDPDHQLMLQKRKAMHESITQRFNECNRDNDDSLDREETTLCLPQVARHFSYVDVDGDGVITLEELELAHTKMTEKQRAAEAQFEVQQTLPGDSDAEQKAKNKQKNSPVVPASSSANSSGKEISAARKRPS